MGTDAINACELAERTQILPGPKALLRMIGFCVGGGQLESEFIDENGGGPGVRLRNPHHKKS
jgi:hypothetical protein